MIKSKCKNYNAWYIDFELTTSRNCFRSSGSRFRLHTQPLHEKIDEYAHPCGHGCAPDEQHVKSFAVLRIVLFEQRYQTVAGEVARTEKRPSRAMSTPNRASCVTASPLFASILPVTSIL